MVIEGVKTLNYLLSQEDKMSVVKAKDLQVGMKVKENILGKKGDIKVRKGEVLSGMHVNAMKSWQGLDDANPNGMQVESSPLNSGQELPNTVNRPWESPLIENAAKKKLESTLQVPGIYDENGKCLNPSPLEKELAQKEEENASDNQSIKRGRGRPKKA